MALSLALRRSRSDRVRQVAAQLNEAAAAIKEAAIAEGGRRPQENGETCGPAPAWGRARAQWAADDGDRCW
jgi:hypothetical protein